MNIKIITQNERRQEKKTHKNKNPACTVLLHVYKIQENKKMQTYL